MPAAVFMFPDKLPRKVPSHLDIEMERRVRTPKDEARDHSDLAVKY